MRFAQRQAVMADPEWREGRYYGESFPHRGLRVAREMGTLTYRSGPEWMERFGRKRTKDELPRLDEDYQVESYLAYQGDKFCLQYDPNSYLYISKAMDLFDLAPSEPSKTAALDSIHAPALIIGVTSDVLFPVWQQQELRDALERAGRPVRYVEIDGLYGHDTFLIDVQRVGTPLREHLTGES